MKLITPMWHRAAAFAWALAAAAVGVQAQEHRATHLGNPATRFADPVTRSADLRDRFQNERLKADIISILRQVHWNGDPADLFQAASHSPITAIRIMPGERLPFMSSRDNGRPVALKDVFWAGKDPIEAYAFSLTSKGRRYRCITPKACSNFYLVDLGPDRPNLQLVATVPPEAGTCDPIVLKVLLRNAGYSPLTEVHFTRVIPDALEPLDSASTSEVVIPFLRAGEVREVRMPVQPRRGGMYEPTFSAVCAEGGTAKASGRMTVRAASLAIECTAPPEVPIGRTVEVCLKLRNAGDAVQPRAKVTLPVPSGASLESATGNGRLADGHLEWEVADLQPQATDKLCARFTATQPQSFAWVADAQGPCTAAVGTRCETRVLGVPGILLEVVDLEDPIEVGKDVTYEIRITNQGSGPLTHVRAVCTVPEIQEFVSAKGTTGAEAAGRTVTLTPVDMLEGKAVASWSVVTRAGAAGVCQFQVDLTSDQLSRPVRETESTSQY